MLTGRTSTVGSVAWEEPVGEVREFRRGEKCGALCPDQRCVHWLRGNLDGIPCYSGLREIFLGTVEEFRRPFVIRIPSLPPVGVEVDATRRGAKEAGSRR